MADQGASERRGLATGQSTPIGQATTTAPQSSAGDTYFDSSAGIISSDSPSAGASSKETQYTAIGIDTSIGTSEVSSAQGKSYFENSLGAIQGHDVGSGVARTKENQVFPIGQSGTATATTSAGGVYFESNLGALSPIVQSGGGGGSTTIYYKLRARDTGASYVEWVTTVTPLTTASYPGTPVGSLVELTVLSQHT